MSLLSKKVSLLWLLAALLFTSCEKELSCYNCGGANKPPVANAGTDQTITLPANEVKLDGGGSFDPDNNITSYRWAQITTPPTVTIVNPAAVKTGVANFVKGTYQFELKVTDAFGLFSKDTVVITVADANTINPRWTQLNSLPREEFTLGSQHINFLIGIQDKVFAISKHGRFWYYDPQKSEWTEKSALPTQQASSNFSVVFSIGNIGYVIGNGTCRKYNLVTNQWTYKNNAPVGDNHVDYAVPLVIGDKAYLVGSTNNVVTLYNPLDDTYTQKNRFPGVDAAAGFVVDGQGYCIQRDGQCWKYDVATDSWKQKASLPSSIYSMSGFSLNHYGYIIGDLNRAAYTQNAPMKLWQYDPSSDTWKQIDSDYTGQAVYEIRTVSANGIVYAGLGYTSDGKDATDFWTFK